VFPVRGTKRETLPPGLHISTYRHQATIAYVIDETRDQVSVLRIFGAGQDYESALREDDPDIN
jgi:plasmid stabilization system protein ParE